MKFILALFITLPFFSMAQDENTTVGSSDFDTTKHQWEHRVLLLFTEDITSEVYAQQLSELNKNTEALKVRKLIYYTITPVYFQLMNDQIISSKNAWIRYKRSKSPFSIMLIGLDSGIKLQKSELLRSKALFDKIDSMPMRQAELRNRKE